MLEQLKKAFAIGTDLILEPQTLRYVGHEMQVLGSSISPGSEYRVTLRHDFRSDIIGQESVIAEVEVPGTGGICLRYTDINVFSEDWDAV